jgi:hypothetical protein
MAQTAEPPVARRVQVMVPSQESTRARRQPSSLAIGGLIGVAIGTFFVASIIHFGFSITLGTMTIKDPLPGAAIPEGIIATVLTIGGLAQILRLPARWWVALATTLFALLVTLYGLTLTVRSALIGDIIYHVCICIVLAIIVGLLLLPTGRRSMSY